MIAAGSLVAIKDSGHRSHHPRPLPVLVGRPGTFTIDSWPSGATVYATSPNGTSHTLGTTPLTRDIAGWASVLGDLLELRFAGYPATPIPNPNDSPASELDGKTRMYYFDRSNGDSQ